MGWQIIFKQKPAQKKLFTELNDEEKKVMELFENNEELTIDQIALQCNISVSKISYLLINLEFNGLIKCLPGKVYKKSG